MTWHNKRVQLTANPLRFLAATDPGRYAGDKEKVIRG